MTYNFDPDKWFEQERVFLKRRYQEGRITEKEYADALEKLSAKLEKMWNRLDGTYQMPPSNRDS